MSGDHPAPGEILDIPPAYEQRRHKHVWSEAQKQALAQYSESGRSTARDHGGAAIILDKLEETYGAALFQGITGQQIKSYLQIQRRKHLDRSASQQQVQPVSENTQQQAQPSAVVQEPQLPSQAAAASHIEPGNSIREPENAAQGDSGDEPDPEAHFEEKQRL